LKSAVEPAPVATADKCQLVVVFQVPVAAVEDQTPSAAHTVCVAVNTAMAIAAIPIIFLHIHTSLKNSKNQQE
jgi:hypothetical protein